MTVKANPLRFSIIIASSGRPTLSRTLQSLTPQMQPGDELLLSVNDTAPWGHAARNELMTRARGHALLFIDDDDTYTPDALATMRRALDQDPLRVHLFRMAYLDGHVIWQVPELVEGQVSTQTVLVPNIPGKLGTWTPRYAGDFDFIARSCELLGEPAWHEEVVALCRP